jgi:hypothetical protein
MQEAAPVEPRAVDEGPVRRAQVENPYPVALGFDPGVVGGGELVALEGDRIVVRTPDGERYRPGLEGLPDLDRLALLDHESPARGRRMLDCQLGGREDEALLRGDAQVACGRADHPPDEEVEEDEEEGLEGEEDRLDAHRAVFGR